MHPRITWARSLAWWSAGLIRQRSKHTELKAPKRAGGPGFKFFVDFQHLMKIPAGPFLLLKVHPKTDGFLIGRVQN